MPRIKLIVIEGDLSIEDTARLAHALGAAPSDAAALLPPGVKGVEATLRTPEPVSAPVVVPSVAVHTPAPESIPTTPPSTPPKKAAGRIDLFGNQTVEAAPVPKPSEVIQQTREVDAASDAAPEQKPASPLASARKLRDVLEALRGQGITTAEALVAECQRVRAEVPILARIAADQIDERVRRTLEGMA